MAYSAGNAEDVREHKERHDRVVNGIRARPLKGECVIWAKNDSRIVVITDSSNKVQRDRVEWAGVMAREDTPYSANDICGGNKAHAFLLYKNHRTIGLLAMEKGNHIWKTGWAERKRGENPTEINDNSPTWSIFMAWILEKYRGSGFAAQLVNVAMKYIKSDFNHVGWRTPFTDSGEALVKHFCPCEFYIVK